MINIGKKVDSNFLASLIEIIYQNSFIRDSTLTIISQIKPSNRQPIQTRRIAMKKFPTSPLTPEQKASQQQSRTLSDAKLIENGARYIPNLNGEPILTINLIKSNTDIIIKRESPEARKMIELFEKLRPVYSGFNVVRLVKGVAKYKELFSNERDSAPGKTIYESPKKQVSVSKYSERGAYSVKCESYLRTNIFFSDSEKEIPCIIIKRSDILQSIYTTNIEESGIKLTRCYSTEEFYNNLTSEEKKGGEKLGKELENYLEKE